MEDLNTCTWDAPALCMHCTLPLAACLCKQAPDLSDTHITVLFHPREIEKHHSTGRLLSHCCNLDHYHWHRKNEQLPKLLQHHTLVYPSEDHLGNSIPDTGPLLLIDSTWQQSKKMLRQSPWLKALPKAHISAESSLYKLRRNQIQGGLSTLEAAAHLLAARGDEQTSEKLVQFLLSFQAQYKKH